MELIDRYVAEVGRRVPEELRSDIEAEIRSLLEDTLEDRAREQTRQPDEQLAVEILKSYGSPEKLAADYLPPRYLVGPRWYPYFIRVVKIVMLVLGIVALVLFGVRISLAGGGLVQIGVSLIEALNTFISGGLTALGVIGIIFAVLEWKAPQKAPESEDWDPSSLKPVPPKADEVKTSSLIFEIVLGILSLLVFLFYVDRIGLYMLVEGRWTFLPILTQTFYNFIPWIAAVWALGVVVKLVVLRQGHWQRGTRWFSAGVSLLGILLVIVLLAGAPLIAVSPQALQALAGTNISPETAANLESAILLSLRLALSVILVIEGVQVGKTLYRLVWKKNEAFSLPK